MRLLGNFSAAGPLIVHGAFPLDTSRRRVVALGPGVASLAVIRVSDRVVDLEDLSFLITLTGGASEASALCLPANAKGLAVSR